MKLKNKIAYMASGLRATICPPRVDTNCHQKHLTKEGYLSLVSQLKPGDVVLTKPISGVLSNMFIGGTYTHAGIYVGRSFDEQYQHGFVHAIHPAATVEEFAVPMTQYTGFQVWRSNLTEEEVDLVCKRAKNTVNKVTKYDFKFLSSAETTEDVANLELYCSELVEFAYRPFIGKVVFRLDAKLGKPFLIPDKFISDGRGFSKVFET